MRLPPRRLERGSVSKKPYQSKLKNATVYGKRPASNKVRQVLWIFISLHYQYGQSGCRLVSASHSARFGVIPKPMRGLLFCLAPLKIWRKSLLLPLTGEICVSITATVVRRLAYNDSAMIEEAANASATRDWCSSVSLTVAFCQGIQTTHFVRRATSGQVRVCQGSQKPPPVVIRCQELTDTAFHQL
jgi:hypothetical protein